jgi:transglutaminase-like putative cysteine protease
MLRSATVHLDLRLTGHTNMIFSMTPAIGATLASERIDFRQGDQPIVSRELVEAHGTRLHTFVAEAGTVSVDYDVRVSGRAEPAAIDERDGITYLRPSRYAQSDSLTPMARSEFRGLNGYPLVQAITDWVFEHLTYASGSSRPTDGAIDTMASRRGVCRDFAHVTIALLRALDIPARMASVYAPGLSPMDFHAIAEAFVDGAWWAIDSTRLAPRQSLVRIATGRDAADTAWLTSNWTDLSVAAMSVTATVDALPLDDHRGRVQLG